MIDAGSGNKKISIAQRRYLGGKSKLLTFIDEILVTEKAEYSSFMDIFAGTGVVASYFHEKSSVIVNDILESNYMAYVAFFGKERIRIKWLEAKLVEYNIVDISHEPDNYFSLNFANTYFDETNSKRIGYIRDDIEKLYSDELINTRERAYLVTALIYALDRIANTVGHYDAYRKVDIALRRLELRPLTIHNHKFSAKVFNKDANELAKVVRADVVYIDPPYNSRQYSDSYHLLENVATWKKEEVHGIAKKIDRTHLKSKYSLKSASHAFSDLINSLDTKYILVSYNDMGTSGDARSQSRISDHELISALERRGDVTVYEKPFNQFTTGKSKRDDLKERVFFCRVNEHKKNRLSVQRSQRNSHTQVYVKSPLNYTGGKHKLLPQLSKYWPENIDTFYDMFCGAGNVGINANAKKVICIDKNISVIEILKLIKETNFEELHQSIEDVIDKFGLSKSYINGYDYYGCESSTGLGKYNKDAFMRLRSAYNASKGYDKPLLLLVLILYGFNNQIRFNSKGEFNLPVGKRDYNGSSRRNLADFNAITVAKNVDFIEGDFRDLKIMKFKKDDFVYVDPPYLLGLASYNEGGGWSVDDEKELYRTLDAINKKGIRFALSNVVEHKGETNNILFEWAKDNNYNVNFLDFHYKNSNYQSTAKHGVTKEVIVTNFPISTKTNES